MVIGRPVSCDTVFRMSCGTNSVCASLRAAVSLMIRSAEPGNAVAPRYWRAHATAVSAQPGMNLASVLMRQLVEQVAGEGDRALLLLGLELDRFQQAAQHGPKLDEARGRRWISLRSISRHGQMKSREVFDREYLRSVPDGCRFAQVAAGRECTR